nr:protein WVD2-like 7 isoform X3 [Arachis hypogaea]
MVSIAQFVDFSAVSPHIALNDDWNQSGDSMRVLGESISFGRFLSESLNWERWSSFTSNRYVEEAEKYSKPGSVAAKKAYFEARYKRKAAEKQAVLAQEANEASGTFNSETLESNCNDSSDVAELSADAIATSDEQPDKEADDCQVIIDCTSRNNLDVGQSDSGISNVHGEGDGSYTHVITNESCVITDDSNQHDQIEIHQNIALPGEEKKSDHGVADPRSGIKKKSISILTKNRRQTSQSLHMSINLSSGNGETSKTDAQSRNGVNSTLKSKKAVEVSIEKKRLTGPSGANKTSMTATATAAVKPRPENHTLKGMKPGGGSVEKRPTSSSLRRSLNLPSSTGKATEMASVFDKRIERNHCSLRNIPKVRPLASNISTKLSYDFSNQDSENPPYPGRRTEEVLKSVSRGVAANVKLPSASSECMKSSSSNKIIHRPPTMSSPFRFRSEERAVKRKEFLERVYGIKNKVEKIQFQRTPENNIKHDFKLGQSSGSKPKLNEDGHGASCSPSNQIQKTSVTHKSFGNSWKPPISTNNSNRATEKLNRSTRNSVTSMTKITRENASPNIQH